MKKNLQQMIDNMTPDELEALGMDFKVRRIGGGKMQRIKSKTRARIGLKEHNVPCKRRVWIAYAAGAASLCVIVGLISSVGFWGGERPVMEQSGELEQTEAPGKELPKAMSVQELLAREDFAGILWGAGTSEDNVPTPDDPQGGVGDAQPLEHVTWNGIALSDELYSALTTANPDSIIAVTAENLVPNTEALENFVYNGKTYAEYFEPWAASNDAVNNMQGFCKIATRYEKWNKGEDAFWEKLHEDVADSEQLIARFFDGERFLIDRIREEIDALRAVSDQYNDAWRECCDAYFAQQTPIALLLLAENGYYVVENCGRYVVFIKVQDMQTFAKDVVVAYGEDAMQARFRFATPEELGVESVKLVPGGVQENVPENVPAIEPEA